MNRGAIIVAAASLSAALGLGYWWGAHTAVPEARTAREATGTGDGRVAPRGERRILYYRHPMGLPDTSPVPKKDSMGMDYVPVYSDEGPDGPGFVVPRDRLQRLGVRTTEAGPRRLVRTVHAVGTIAVDERLQATVTTRFDGYVTKLHVATTGAPVRRGQPLLEVYSPELVSAQEEYRIAQRNLRELGGTSAEVRARLERLVEATTTRLRNWDVDPDDLPALTDGKVERNVLLRSPAEGVVLDKQAVIGQRFTAGEPLYRVAGLSRVWLMAEVFEQDLGMVAPGRAAHAKFEAYPGRVFPGTVSFAYPTVDDATRTLELRIELPNPDGALKPGLYGTVEIAGTETLAPVAVPESAVLDSGTRTLVFVAHAGGRFEPREVHLGARGDGHVAVLSGLVAGEAVVVDGNFLIDAESNLRAGTQALGHVHGESGPAGARTPATAEETEPAAASDAHAGHEGHGPAGAAGHEGHPAPAASGHEGHDLPTAGGHEEHGTNEAPAQDRSAVSADPPSGGHGAHEHH